MYGGSNVKNMIYQLSHEYSERESESGEPLFHNIELGYYDSKKRVNEIILKYKNLKGFKEHSVKCFKIKKWKVPLKEVRGNFLYELYHAYIADDGYEEFNYLGVFPSLEVAEKKKLKLSKKRKFHNHVDGFEITQEILNEENVIWNEGFDKLENLN